MMRIIRQIPFAETKTVYESRILRGIPRQAVDRWNDDPPVLVGSEYVRFREKHDPNRLGFQIPAVCL